MSGDGPYEDQSFRPPDARYTGVYNPPDVRFTPQLRTDHLYQDGWLREDLRKVQLFDGIILSGDTLAEGATQRRALMVPDAVMGEILNLLEYGVNEMSPSAPDGSLANLTLIIPVGGVHFWGNEEEDDFTPPDSSEIDV